ncbi:MAG TPA: histidine kinase dimerization/phosphoacceptor domain -containing protein [Sphingomicrobium sp.]|nr:histidine kinase dimerization/phosphoacceptor domain -containing protein [Sphingomicrobium sp.]
MTDPAPPERNENLLETPHLAGVLESEHFKSFLDHVPVAIAVSELSPSERIVYVNEEFERLSGQAESDLIGEIWGALTGSATAASDDRELSDAIADDQDYIGAFTIAQSSPASLNAWSNVIRDDSGAAVFRLVALSEAGKRSESDEARLEQLIGQKDTLLRELQHRVKNNLQMITALIRLEARALPDEAIVTRFDRLAGRIEALALLYRSLSEGAQDENVDLGTYLSEVAAAVMRAHAVEGISLDLKVDSWPVSLNVAMPAGLVVNELLTNSIKHAFKGRDGGTITLHCTVQENGCRVDVSDDGIGLGKGVKWPTDGKMAALIVRSLVQNAGARFEVNTAPGEGVGVTIYFDREDAEAG